MLLEDSMQPPAALPLVAGGLLPMPSEDNPQADREQLAGRSQAILNQLASSSQ